MIEHTITDWAASLGMDYKTLKTALNRAGIQAEARQAITAVQIKVAILGDERAEKVRNFRLDAALKQAELDEIERRTVQWPVVSEMIGEIWKANRDGLLQMRAALPPLCNPQDHACSKREIDRAVTEHLSKMVDIIKTKLELEIADEQTPTETANP